ncbi:helix-hairpin-helix domain-containing protein [Methylobacter sp.]|uniref:ComEA family DNA-binding protein n=1 Tax=Methylobacter sp. TaxID=2051955 RepID=UPI0024871CD5|nr:helix-hairpin-helix domain-containing protein [Methylobacter sp.]MDI1277394.1 helix-hairpin-helix domain-containing protein [Methylobacter sp.]MDI1357960.1 helix-hairpin-helix domain-containing protein [Methylobacter sp.]
MLRLLVVLFAAFCSFNVIASPVNINTADVKTIGEALSGIGQKKAEAIVKYRETKGEFKTVEDLVNVDGIGVKTVEKIKNDVLLSDAAAVADQKTDKKIDEKTDKQIEEKTK